VTATEILALLSGVIAAAQAVEASGGDPMSILQIVNEHPAVVAAQAAVQADVTAKFGAAPVAPAPQAKSEVPR